MNETTDSLRKNLALCRVWSELLGIKKQPNSNDYVDIENHASRFDSLTRSSCSEASATVNRLLQTCDGIIKKESSLSEYVLTQQRRVADLISPPIPVEEIIDSSPVLIDAPAATTATVEEEPAYTKIENSSSIDLDSVHDLLNLIRVSLSEDNMDNLKSHLAVLFKNYDQEVNKLLMMNLMASTSTTSPLLSFNELQDGSVVKQSIKENHLAILINALVEINSTESSALSYNLVNSFLKIVLYEYVMANLYDSEKSKEVLSRRVFNLCASVSKEFSRQFIDACLINWLMSINVESAANSSILASNKLLVEFMMKIVRDCFTETESLIMLKMLLMNPNSAEWYENVYSVASALVDKTGSMNYETLSLLLNRMKLDSVKLCKSNLFSKLLLSLLNKSQGLLSSSTAGKRTDNGEDQTVSHTTSNQLIHLVEAIIDNNKTLMRTTLLNILKKYKS